MPLSTTDNRTLNEKRAEIRLESCVDLKIWIEGKPVRGCTKDISASGILLHACTAHPFQSGDQYKLEICIPKDHKTIQVTGAVIRVDTQPQCPEKSLVAFHFLDISKDDQLLIREFIHRRRMERRILDTSDLPTMAVRVWVDGKAIPSTTKDISTLGIKLRLVCTEVFRTHQCYPMELDLPGAKKPIRAIAKVVRIDEQPKTKRGRWQLAFEFTDIQDKAAVREFVFHDVAHHLR
jgi:c-di-GMP-binding flagellar brake protein YcgR